MPPGERAIEALCTWQRTDRHHDLNEVVKILEAAAARVPTLNTVGAVMSKIRRQGWQKAPSAERSHHMRWVVLPEW